MNWYLKVLKEHYADFNGRARRQEYWMFFLFNLIFSIGIGVVEGIIGTTILGVIFSLAMLIPGLAVSVRRLHDIGKSGWWYLLVLLPIIGWIWLIILFATDSEDGTNNWGENPKELGNDTAINEIGRE